MNSTMTLGKLLTCTGLCAPLAGPATPGEVLRCYLVARFISTEQLCLPLEWRFEKEPESLPREAA